MGFCDVGWHKFLLSPSSQSKICRAITELGFLPFSECKGNFLLGLRDVKVSRKITEYGPGKKERKKEGVNKRVFLISKKHVVINLDFETSLKFVSFKHELIHSIKFDHDKFFLNLINIILF
jgi:hypothetical protein